MTISADEMKTPGFIFSSYFFLKYTSSLKTFKLKIFTNEIIMITTWNHDGSLSTFVQYHVSVNFGVKRLQYGNHKKGVVKESDAGSRGDL